MDKTIVWKNCFMAICQMSYGCQAQKKPGTVTSPGFKSFIEFKKLAETELSGHVGAVDGEPFFQTQRWRAARRSFLPAGSGVQNGLQLSGVEHLFVKPPLACRQRILIHHERLGIIGARGDLKKSG